MSASFCWQCGRKFVKVKGKRVFETVTIDGTNEVKVHKTCVKSLKKPDPDYANAGVKNAVHKYLGEEQ